MVEAVKSAIVTNADDSTQIGIFAVPVECSRVQRAIIARVSSDIDSGFVSEILVPLIEHRAPVSLRALDWLVTNYAKKFNIVSEVRAGHIFNIYHGYKTALSHFRRRNFDPFRRRIRIRMTHGDQVFDTTVGQCNFFHWAHNNGVLRYAFEHAKSIESDMNRASAKQKSNRKRGVGGGGADPRGRVERRKELSNAPLSKCSVYAVNTRVSFRCVGEE
jgi:hypothetical protein